MGFFSHKYTISVNRDSVSMGDDMCSHTKELNLDENLMLSTLLSQLSNYVPAMNRVIWAIKSNTGTLGYLISDDHANITIKLSIHDMELKNSGIQRIYCKYYYPDLFGGESLDSSSFLEKVKWDNEI